jgi:hypothetical protein
VSVDIVPRSRSGCNVAGPPAGLGAMAVTGGKPSFLICPGWDASVLKAAIRHNPRYRAYLSSTAGGANRRGISSFTGSSQLSDRRAAAARGIMPYIQISDDVRSLAGAGA